MTRAQPRERLRRGLRAAGVVGLLVAIAVQPAPAGTAASWADAEHATTTLTAGHLDPPPALACWDSRDLLVLLGETVRYTWSAPAEPSIAPTGYTIVLTAQGGLGEVVGEYSTPPEGPSVDGDGRLYLDIPTTTFLTVGTSWATIHSTFGPTWTSAQGTVASEDLRVVNGVLGVALYCGPLISITP